MVLDHLLNSTIHIGGLSGLDLLPAQNVLVKLLKSYLIAGTIEGKSPKTLKGYCQTISCFVKSDVAQVSDVHYITAQHIRLFLLSIQQKGVTAFTVSAYYRSLHTFFNWLVAEGFIDQNPMHNIKPPKVPKMVIKPFSAQDIEHLLLLCSGNTFLDTRNRAIILLFLDTGLRLDELSCIGLNSINFDQETIKVMGKGAKERIVRMGKTTQKALLKYLLMREDNYPCLWLTEERKPLKRAGVQIAIKRLCHRAEITDAKPGPHSFRHTAAIACLRNGMDIFTLQEMLGHETLEMTRRYTRSLGADDVIRAHRTASPVDKMKLK